MKEEVLSVNNVGNSERNRRKLEHACFCLKYLFLLEKEIYRERRNRKRFVR